MVMEVRLLATMAEMAGVPSLSGVGHAIDTQASRLLVLVLATGPHDGDVTDVELDWGFDKWSGAVVLSHPDGTVAGELGDDGTITFSLDAWSSAVSFFDLGVEHIQYGLDHLLFLLVLTLAAVGTTVNNTTTWRAVKLVIGGLWLSGKVLVERFFLVRTSAAVGAALVGLAWTASRLGEVVA